MSLWNRIKSCRKKGQKGNAIAMLAMGIPFILFTGGITVDLGSYYLQASNLQNAADSAAAAGAYAYYTNTSSTGSSTSKTSEGTTTTTTTTTITSTNTRIVPVVDDFLTDSDGNATTSFDYNVDGVTYRFTLNEDDKDTGDEVAADFISKDTGGRLSIDSDGTTTRLWDCTGTAANALGESTSYTDAYCYRVDLADPIDLPFTRALTSLWPSGTDPLSSITVNASSMAVIVNEPTSSTVTDLIRNVNANIYNTIPNYYWEAITDYGWSTSNTGTITEVNSSTGKTKTKSTFGYRNSKYFTDLYSSYIKDIVTVENLSDDPAFQQGKKNILAYDYSNLPVTQKWCADPILGKDTVGLKKFVYVLNKDLITTKGIDYATGQTAEITGLFLDRPNVSHNGYDSKGNYVNGSKIRATQLDITDDSISNDNTTPLYIRFESEPTIGNTFAQPITINTLGVQKKPLIIAYDGPDLNRTTSNVPAVNVNTGEYSTSEENGNYKQTSTITSPPYTVNLDKDFYGVIYAPLSKITINGSGKIYGFIMAKEIVDNGATSTRKNLISDEVEIPAWGVGSNYWTYNVTAVKSTYTVVYDKFKNYTTQAPVL